MFKFVDGPKPYHKDIFLGGADHMEVDEQGNIYGDTYLFEQENLIQLAREAEDFAGRVDAKAGRSHVTIDLPTFDKEVLRDFRQSLEPKRVKR